MHRLPIGVQIGGKVNGFAAVYVVMLAGCAFFFGIALWLLPEGTLRTAVVAICLAAFVVLCVLACCIGLWKSDRFVVKEEHHSIIEFRGAKGIEGSITTTVSELGPPKSTSQLDEAEMNQIET